MATVIDVAVLKFGFVQREIGEIVRYLPLKLSRLRGSRPKSAKPDPNNVLTVLQFSYKSVHFRRSYSRTREHRFCPLQYFHNLPDANFYLPHLYLTHLFGVISIRI